MTDDLRDANKNHTYRKLNEPPNKGHTQMSIDRKYRKHQIKTRAKMEMA